MKSYFDYAVKVAVFMAAIPVLVERLLRSAGKLGSISIQVVFTGDTACCTWTYTSKGILGTIKLPALKVGTMIERGKANRWVAYVIHEVWHVVFTGKQAWDEFCRRYPGLRAKLLNAVEDARIERAGMALGYAEGFKVHGRELLGHMLATGGMDVDPNDPRQIPWVFAVGCRGYGVRGEARLLSKLDPRIRAILDEAKARIHAIPVDIDPEAGTTAAGEIALWIYDQLQTLGTARDPGHKPEPPQPPQPDGRDDDPESDDTDETDPESEAGDHDYDDEHPEPGEPGEPGEDGEPGEGGDTEPPALEVGDKVVCPDGSKGIITAIEGDDATVAPLD